MLAGLGAIFSLPIEQYPDIAPPQVNVRASYPGASAETIENSVTQIIEQQITGIDGILYFSSSSSSRGSVSISAIFAKGTDPDVAQVQVQNQVSQAISRLPQQVQQQGIRVTKSNPDFLLIVAVYDATDQRTNMDVSDYLASNIQDPLSRVTGVGDVNVFGAPHAMRIWLNPERLAAFSLMPSDVVSALQAQNTEIAAGEVGGLPQADSQMLDATVTSQGKLQTPEQFRNIILKTDPSGATVRLGDVARVELGADNYGSITRVNRHPGAGIAISLAPGADALKTAELVKQRVQELSANFPEGIHYAYASDTTNFIKLSVDEVAKTLFEAIVLVILVIFVFLQNWRALLVPAIAIPVVLLGTFAVFYIAGFTINTMTLFGLTLAVGLLVDDAIVVVENVERLLHENPGMTPKEATIESMAEIQVALIAIAMSLSAVFLPMAFFGGSTGVIYKQFSLTIVSAMVLSVFVALIFSPALTSTMLRQRREDTAGEPTWLDRRAPVVGHTIHRARTWFNTGFEQLVVRYRETIVRVIDRKWLMLGIYALVCLVLVVMFLRLPTGFSADRRSGRSPGPVPPSARRYPEPHRRGSTADRRLFRATRRQKYPDPVHRRGWRRRRRSERPEHRPGIHEFRRLVPAARQGQYRRCDRAARVERLPQRARRPGLRARAGRDPGPRPIKRLHDGASEPQRDEPRAIFGRARQAARSSQCQSQADRGPHRRLAGRRDAQCRCR